MEVIAQAEVPEPAQEGRIGSGDRNRSLSDRVGFWAFLAMVVLAPVPDGSVALIWIQVWTAFAAVAVVLVSYRDVSRGAAWLVGGLLIILAAYALVGVLQSVVPGPAPLEIWSDAGQILGIEIAPLSGSVRQTPLLFFGRPLLAALVLTAAIVIGPDRRRADKILRSIVGAACIYGLIGFAASVFDSPNLRPFEQNGALTTFFLNKNTSATYLGSAVLIVLSLILPQTLAAAREQKTLSSFFNVERRRRFVIDASAGLFLLILLPLTLSRAGLMLTATVGIGATLLKLRVRRRAQIWKIALGVLVIFSLIYGLSGGQWRERQVQLGFDSLGRIEAYQMMLSAVAKRPLIGYGLGSFAESFPQFRTEDLGTAAIFDIGHSTPVELIFEGGYPLAFTVFAYVTLCGGLLVRGALRRPNDSYILAGLLVGLMGAAHTSFDFPLQIPGLLIIYLAVVGIGLGRSFLPREKLKVTKKTVRRRQVRPAHTPYPEASTDPAPLR